MISAAYTMNLFNTSDTQGAWACENYQMKDRMMDLLDELSEHVDTTMVDKVADFIEEAVDYYKASAEEYEHYKASAEEYEREVEEYEREVEECGCEIERLEDEIIELEEELRKEKEKSEDGSGGDREIELESGSFNNLSGYNKARKEILAKVKEMRGMSQKERIYIPKGVIEMQVLVYGEVVKSLRLSSKEFMNYIREHKTDRRKFRLRMCGTMIQKNEIDWKNNQSVVK